MIHKTRILLLVLILLGSCSSEPGEETRDSDPDVREFKLVAEIESDPQSPFYVDFKTYPSQRKSLPIGIFDSGTGGLSVLNAIVQLDRFDNRTHEPGSDGIPDFISEKFVYLGDKANMPYGRYPSEGKTDFLQELIIKDAWFLLTDQYFYSLKEREPLGKKLPVKALVIACNTATAYGYELIQDVLREWDLDVKAIGIIDAGAKQAVRSFDPNKDRVMGVFATQGTCDSEGYVRALKKYYSESSSQEMTVIQQPCLGLAGAVDGDPVYIVPDPTGVRGTEFYQGPGVDHQKYPIRVSLWDEYHFEQGSGLLVEKNDEGEIIEVELNSIGNYIRYCVTSLVVKVIEKKAGPLGSVILGCTHYALYQSEFRDHFLYLRSVDEKYRSVIHEDLEIIDPAQAQAESLYLYLKENNLFGNQSHRESRFFISLPNPLLPSNQIDSRGEFFLNYKYGRDINQSLRYVKRVPLTENMLSRDILTQLRNNCPYLYQLLFRPGKASSSQ